MSTTLEKLKQYTTVVADTGDITAIAQYQPQDATTNPSLILKAAQMPQYKPLITEAIQYAKNMSQELETQLLHATDRLAVNIGKEILKLIPGKISTEIDARLSYDLHGSIQKAQHLIKMYSEAGIDKKRILIKLASTWQGIQAAEQLEKEGIHCNLTLLFSFAQAKACAQANVYLISPFVGRIMDWYKEKEKRDFKGQDDPGVISVSKIFKYYKSHGYNTQVMGASFRNTEEILQLAGCDRLTISPPLLQALSDSDLPVEQRLTLPSEIKPRPTRMTESEFLWEHHLDAMATEKLAEGIRVFAEDQEKLEACIKKLL